MSTRTVIREDICRACLRTDGLLLPLYGDDKLSRKNLPEKLAELASIQIHQHDGLPSMLCVKCAYRTDVFYDFKLQVQTTERQLRQMLEAQRCPKIEKEEWIVAEEQMGFLEPDELMETESIELVKEEDFVDSMKVEKLDVSNESSREVQIVDIAEESIDEVHRTNIMENPIEDERAEIEELDDIFNIELQPDGLSPQPDSQDVKEEVPNEIKDILKSEDMGYTIMYIPDDTISTGVEIDHVYISDNTTDAVIETDHSNMYIKDNTTKTGTETDQEDVYISGNTMKYEIESEDDDVDSNANHSTDPNGADNVRLISVVDECLSARFRIGKAVNGEDSESEKEKEGLKKIGEVADSEDGESDYFVDRKDNLLGSLNDAIIKIKEVKTENDVMIYQCTLCLENYDELTGALLHTIDNHVPVSGPFFCMVCEKDCESLRHLRSHVKAHTGELPYNCFICNKAYSLKRYLKRHMVCHADFPRYRCPKCGKRFKAKMELDSHILTHTHGSPYACNHCPRVFNHKGNYKRHLITHLDPQRLQLPKYPCEFCDKRFPNKRTLTTHIRVHTGERPFTCDKCNKSFTQQGNLLNHARIHLNPRGYTCEVCGKQFNQRATLRDHSLLHTGEKPYVCNVCGVAFTFSAALRRHMWTHSGGKPYGCEICDARFVGKYDLKRHMTVHSDRPRIRKKRNQIKDDDFNLDEPNEQNLEVQEPPDVETILIEQVLLNQDATQVVPQEESEKENVDALFNLIQYGE